MWQGQRAPVRVAEWHLLGLVGIGFEEEPAGIEGHFGGEGGDRGPQQPQHGREHLCKSLLHRYLSRHEYCERVFASKTLRVSPFWLNWDFKPSPKLVMRLITPVLS